MLFHNISSYDFMVNSVNVRRFLSSMVGMRRECLESIGSITRESARGFGLLHTHVVNSWASPRDIDPADAPGSSHVCVLFGDTDGATGVRLRAEKRTERA